METDLRIFSLNCWGIPVVSKDRHIRIKAISTVIASNKYDIICLQEVWSLSDFELIVQKTLDVLPYSHYFHSGVVGSGVCILSRYPIQDAFFHQWAVNGYIHKLQHGDWFGGKGVGLCRIRYKDISVHVYSAHLHAEYNTNCDEYQAHRILQAFDTAQFIRLTAGNADLVVLAGDLNTEPGNLAYRVLLAASGLRDAYLEVNDASMSDIFGTHESQRNSYSSKKEVKKQPKGKRIDYVLFKSGACAKVDLVKYELPLADRVPGQNFSYSDHEAVLATLRVHGIERTCIKRQLSTLEMTSLKECIEVCTTALKSVRCHKIHYWVYVVLLAILLIGTAGYRVPYMFEYLIIAVRILVTFLMFYAMIMATIWNNIEKNAIKCCLLAMQINLQSLIPDPNDLEKQES